VRRKYKYLLIIGILFFGILLLNYLDVFKFSIYHKGDVKITTICYANDATSFRCPTTYAGYRVSECDVYSYTTAVLMPGEYCTYPQCRYIGGVCIEIWGYPQICTPNTITNYRCSGAYRVWDVCSSDGTRWITQSQYCQFGCLNGNCLTSVPAPTIPPKPVWESVVSKLLGWLRNIFSFFTYQIYGEQQPLVGSQQTYTINITTTPPDSDYSDGTYQIQYASWALLDSSGNIISKGDWEEVRGRYYKQITLTIPSNPGNYVITAVIYQYDMRYNATTLSWNVVKEGVVAKEAISLNAKVIAPPRLQPPPITNIISKIVDWLKGLFSWFLR
jgi:hypothetical protein